MADEWRSSTVGEVAQVVGGGTPSTKEPAYWGGDIPWLTPTEVVRADGKTIGSSDRTITSLGLAKSSANLLPAGAVLLTTRASVGFTAIAAVPLATNQGFQSLVPGDGLDPAFLMLWIQANRAEFRERAGGSTFPEVSKVKVRQIPITIPPLEVQRRLVDVIAAIDAHIATLEEEQRSLAALEPGLLASLFREGEGRALQDIAQVIDCEHKTAPATDSPHPYGFSVGTAALKNSAIDFSRAKPVDHTTMRDWTRRAVPQSGDLILAREAPVGALALVPASPPVCLGQRTVLIRPNQDEVDPVWLWGYLRSPVVQAKFAEQSSGLTVAHLNVSDIRSVAISHIPELNDQQRVSHLLTAHLEATAALGTEVATLGIVRSQVLQALLSREVEVPEAYDQLVDASVT